MGNLTNKYIKDTYDGLIKLKDESQGVQPTAQPLQDGLGNDLPAQVSQTEFIITGSLVGNATTADQATSASFAVTASYAENIPPQSDIFVSGATFIADITDPEGGDLKLQRTEGQPEIVVDLDGRYQTLAAAQDENLRLEFIEFATASLEQASSSLNAFTSSADGRLDSLEGVSGSFLITGSVSGNVITMEKQDGTTFPLTVTVPPDQNTTYDLDSLQVGDDVAVTLVGSDASLDTVTFVAGTNVTLTDDGTNNITIDSTQATSVDSALRTTVTGKNVSGSPISKGTPCYVTGSGTGGNLVGLVPADAGNSSLMPAGVVANVDLDPDEEGEVIVVGFINGVDTSLFQPGDNIWVGVGGGYTNERPTGSAQVQKIGNVEKSAVNGSGVIVGPGRSNDVPNLPEGYIFVGDVDQVAQTVSTGSFARRDEQNTFTQNQTIQGNLQVNNNVNINGDGINNQLLNINEQTGQSGSVSVFLNNFGGASQPTMFFSGDNNFFQATGNFTVENSPGGQGTGSMNFSSNGDISFNTQGTGSQNINFSSATGEINATSQNVNINDDFPRFRFNAGYGGDRHLLDINQMTAFYSGYPTMDYSSHGIQRSNAVYNGLVTEFWDSDSFNYGADCAMSPNGFVVDLIGINGDNGDFRLTATSFGTTALLDADTITVGNSVDQYLKVGYQGPNGGTTMIAGETVNIGSPFGYTEDIIIKTTATGSVSIEAGDLEINTPTSTFTQATTLNTEDFSILGSFDSSINLTTAGAGGVNINTGNLNITGETTTQNNINVTGSVNIQNGINTQSGVAFNNINGYNIIDGGSQLQMQGRFEASGETLFTNGFNATGSANVSGSFNLIQGKPAVGTQANIIDIEGQLGYYSGFPPMTQTNFGLQSYSSQQYNGLVTEMWDSPSFNWGTDHAVSANGIFSEVVASGSGNVAELTVYANSNGSTYGSYRAQNIDIGTNSDLETLDLGFVGANSATTKLAGNLVYVGSNFGYTDEIYIDANNELRLDGTDINMTGSVNIQDTMTLAPQDPLPTGGLGELAVSSSNELYFHNGTSWGLIS